MTDDADHPYEGFQTFDDEAPPPAEPRAPRDPVPASRDTANGRPSRIVAGGAVLPRQAPDDADAPTSQWPLRRPSPNPALPGSPFRASPKVDARTAIPRPVPMARQDAQPRPAGTPQPGRPVPAQPLRDTTKVDARTAAQGGQAPLDDMVPIDFPKAIPKAPSMRIPGRGAGAPTVTRVPVTPLPDEARLAAIREATKARLADGRTWKDLAPGQEPTRTAGTIASYKKRGEQLVARFRRERRVSRDVDSFDHMEFAIWLLSLRAGLKPSSWRGYRQAAVMMLGGMPSAAAEAALALIENGAPGETEMGTGDDARRENADLDAGKKQMTSSLKAKYLKYEHYHRIDAYLRLKRRSEAADVLRDWLQAGVATGLRPAEWKATSVTVVPDPAHPMRRRAYLHVINAKATNGRSNGVVRTLDLTNLSDGSLAVVQRMSDAGVAAYAAGKFDDLQSHCAQILYQADLFLFPKRETAYSLYSCRHQFIANQRALGLPNEELSAMAGHIIDATAYQSYGRKASSWPPDKIVDRVRGVPEEIATVRKVLNLHEERQRLEAIMRKGLPKAAKPEVDESEDEGYQPEIG